MSAETFTYSTLSGAAGVTALVGTSPNSRIWPDQAPEGAEGTLIVFERADSQPEYTLLTELAATRVRMNVTCWADTRIAAETLGDAVAAAMLAAGVPVAERDGAFNSDMQAYAAVVGFEIWE